jgi:hypothetical protein
MQKPARTGPWRSSQASVATTNSKAALGRDGESSSIVRRLAISHRPRLYAGGPTRYIKTTQSLVETPAPDGESRSAQKEDEIWTREHQVSAGVRSDSQQKREWTASHLSIWQRAAGRGGTCAGRAERRASANGGAGTGMRRGTPLLRPPRVKSPSVFDLDDDGIVASPLDWMGGLDRGYDRGCDGGSDLEVRQHEQWKKD